MNISQVGVDLIKSFEGCVLKAYKPVPTEKYWTIGYGHYGAEIKSNQKITKDEAEFLLKKDLKKYVDGVNKSLKVVINQNQFDALVSFTYNLGIGALQKSDLLAFINKKDFKNAAKEFPLFVHGGGKVLPGLVKRRNAEKELFEKVIYTQNISIPKEETIIHMVKAGDNLTKIANLYNVSVNDIIKWNNVKDKNVLSINQKLKVIRKK